MMSNLQIGLIKCDIDDVLAFVKDNEHRVESTAFLAGLGHRNKEVYFFLSIRDNEVRMCLSWTKLTGYCVPLSRAGALLDELEEFRIRDAVPSPESGGGSILSGSMSEV